MVRKTVMVSGGFDPIHEGHIALLRDAASYGNVLVALNSDSWLTRKKGKPFQTFEARRTILEAIRYVFKVIPVSDFDGTVCQAIRNNHINYFANGGDRGPDNTPETTLCDELGITLLWGVGGGKQASSSALINEWR